MKKISKQTYDEHMARKNGGRLAKKRAKDSCKSGFSYAFQIDMQATKLLPKTEVNKAYYKTKVNF